MGSEAPVVRRINPWQSRGRFSQGIEITGPGRIFYFSGQTSLNADGALEHTGDMAGQLRLVLDNVETVLREANMALANVVQFNYYTTDMQGFIANAAVITDRLAEADIQPASTLLGVKQLAMEGLLVEIDGVAVA